MDTCPALPQTPESGRELQPLALPPLVSAATETAGVVPSRSLESRRAFDTWIGTLPDDRQAPTGCFQIRERC